MSDLTPRFSRVTHYDPTTGAQINSMDLEDRVSMAYGGRRLPSGRSCAAQSTETPTAGSGDQTFSNIYTNPAGTLLGVPAGVPGLTAPRVEELPPPARPRISPRTQQQPDSIEMPALPEMQSNSPPPLDRSAVDHRLLVKPGELDKRTPTANDDLNMLWTLENAALKGNFKELTEIMSKLSAPEPQHNSEKVFFSHALPMFQKTMAALGYGVTKEGNKLVFRDTTAGTEAQDPAQKSMVREISVDPDNKTVSIKHQHLDRVQDSDFTFDALTGKCTERTFDSKTWKSSNDEGPHLLDKYTKALQGEFRIRYGHVQRQRQAEQIEAAQEAYKKQLAEYEQKKADYEQKMREYETDRRNRQIDRDAESWKVRLNAMTDGK